MRTLEDIVPSRHLCTQIPHGCFADSLLVWAIAPEDFVILRRPHEHDENFPAPTLQEILEAIAGEPYLDVFLDKCHGFCYEACAVRQGEHKRKQYSTSPADVMLKLWLALRK